MSSQFIAEVNGISLFFFCTRFHDVTPGLSNSFDAIGHIYAHRFYAGQTICTKWYDHYFHYYLFI